jgi:hypothetical protein
MRRWIPTVAFLLVAALLATGPTASAGYRSRPAAAHVKSDFNGDGFGDLAVGIPNEVMGTSNTAGAVNVIYGSAAGLSSAGNQFWTQNSPGVPTDAEDGGQFGAALAPGDFNGDGFSDLAVGAPGATINGRSSAGVVVVLYGTRAGLTASGSQFFHQNTELIPDSAEQGDQFGATLGAGNLGKTSEDDLAIGVPTENLGTTEDAGVLHVLYGSITGLSTTGNQLWSQNSPGIQGDGAQQGDVFGGIADGKHGPVAADFGKDGHADLAVPVPGEDLGSVVDAGAVEILYGSAGGLTAAGSQFWTQNSANVAEAAETGDAFGSSLGAANFGKDGHADLAIGTPYEGLGTKHECGVVHVLYGTSSGLTAAGSQLWSQDSAGIKDACEEPPGAIQGDVFGFALATGNFGKSSQADLAVSASEEDIGTKVEAGAAHVIFGSSSGLVATGNQLWSQDSAGIKETAEGGPGLPDLFGASVSAANYGKDFHADLGLGVWGEDLAGNTIFDAGAVNVIYGAPGGLTSTGNQLWSQDSTGVKDDAEANDLFSLGMG